MNTLDGRSVQIGSYVYYFTRDINSDYTPYFNVNNQYLYKISLTDYPTFDQAMRQLVNYSGDLESYSFDSASNTVTFTATIDDLVDSVSADGQMNDYFVNKGDGEKKNGMEVKTPAGFPSLEQMDGDGNFNNQPTHSTNSKMNFDLGMNGPLDAEKIMNLERNSITMTLGDTSISLDLKGLFTEGMTEEEVGRIMAQKFAEAIQNNPATQNDYSCNAVYNPSTGKVDLDIASPTGKSVSASFQEYSPPPTQTEKKDWTAKALDMTVTRISQGGVEQGHTMGITPRFDQINVQEPFAFYVGVGSRREYFLFYDRTQYPYGRADGYDDCSYNYYFDDNHRINTDGMSDDEIKELVAQKIADFAGTISYVKKAEINADKSVTLSIIVGGSAPEPVAGGVEVSVSSWKNEAPSSGSYGNAFGGGEAKSVQQMSVSFSAGSDFRALEGKGFRITDAPYYYESTKDVRVEFTNGAAGKHADYLDVDLSQCASFEDVRQKLEETLNTGIDPASDQRFTVSLQNNGSDYVLTVTANINKLYVTDGEMGLVAGGYAVFSGGEKVGYSQKALDFSSINQSNLDTLAGKGFRIHCATCEGEYINIFFCNTKDDPLPPEFDVPSPKVHNVLVELSKVTDGNKIVEEIVNQISPKLTHFTEVLVDPNSPTTLIARDKRRGDYIVDGVLYRGRISTGVRAPDPEPEPEPPDPPDQPDPPDPPDPPAPPIPPPNRNNPARKFAFMSAHTQKTLIFTFTYQILIWNGWESPRRVLWISTIRSLLF